MAWLAAVLAGLGVWLCAAPDAGGSLRFPARDPRRGGVNPWRRLGERVGELLLHAWSRKGVRGSPSAATRQVGETARLVGRCLVTGAAGGVLLSLAQFAYGQVPSVRLAMGVALAVGLAPAWWEGRAEGARARQMLAALPQLLDLMVICQEAGLNLRESLERAAVAVGGKLGTEVRHLLDTMLPAQVVSDLGERYRLQELKALGGALRQGEMLGTPMVDILRAQADGLREAQRRRVRAAAATAPLKLSLCTVCFFLPSILALVLVPQLLAFLSRW